MAWILTPFLLDQLCYGLWHFKFLNFRKFLIWSPESINTWDIRIGQFLPHTECWLVNSDFGFTDWMSWGCDRRNSDSKDFLFGLYKIKRMFIIKREICPNVEIFFAAPSLVLSEATIICMYRWKQWWTSLQTTNTEYSARNCTAKLSLAVFDRFLTIVWRIYTW